MADRLPMYPIWNAADPLAIILRGLAAKPGEDAGEEGIGKAGDRYWLARGEVADLFTDPQQNEARRLIAEQFPQATSPTQFFDTVARYLATVNPTYVHRRIQLLDTEVTVCLRATRRDQWSFRNMDRLVRLIEEVHAYAPERIAPLMTKLLAEPDLIVYTAALVDLLEATGVSLTPEQWGRIVTGSTSQRVRMWAFEVLGQSEPVSESVLQDLRRIATNWEDPFCVRAAQTLYRVGDRTGLIQLQAYLVDQRQHTDPMLAEPVWTDISEESAAALVALWAEASDAALTATIEGAVTAAERNVRQDMITALADGTATMAAVPFLRAALTDTNPLVQTIAARGLLRRDRTDAEAFAVLATVLAAPVCFTHRTSGYHGSGSIWDYGCTHEFQRVRQVIDADWVAQMREAIATAQFADDSSVFPLLKKIIEVTPYMGTDLHRRVCQVLADRRDPASLAMLRTLLTHNTQEVRADAARHLGELRDTAAVPLLIDRLIDTSADVQLAAVQALAAIGPAAAAAIAPLERMSARLPKELLTSEGYNAADVRVIIRWAIKKIRNTSE